MIWDKTSENTLRSGPFQISKSLVKGEPCYQLWHDDNPLPLGSFPTSRKAIDRANEIEKGGRNS